MSLSQVNRNEHKYLRSENSELSNLTHSFDCVYQMILQSLNCSHSWPTQTKRTPKTQSSFTGFSHHFMLLLCRGLCTAHKDFIFYLRLNAKCKSNVCKIVRLFIDNLLICCAVLWGHPMFIIIKTPFWHSNPCGYFLFITNEIYNCSFNVANNIEINHHCCIVC